MINLITPINSLGYGVAGLNIYKSLLELTNVGLWIIGGPEISSREDYKLIQEGLATARTWDNQAPCIKIWHQHDMAQFVGKGKRIGFPFFELDQFSEQEKHSLNSLDSIFVTSHWAKDIVLSETKIKEVAGTATFNTNLSGDVIVSPVTIVNDNTYLPLLNNNEGDLAFATNNHTMYTWDGTRWQNTKSRSTDEVSEGTTNLYYTDSRAQTATTGRSIAMSMIFGG